MYRYAVTFRCLDADDRTVEKTYEAHEPNAALAKHVVARMAAREGLRNIEVIGITKRW